MIGSWLVGKTMFVKKSAWRFSTKIKVSVFVKNGGKYRGVVVVVVSLFILIVVLLVATALHVFYVDTFDLVIVGELNIERNM